MSCKTSIAFFLAAMLLFACTKATTVAGGGANSQTHWLTACTADDGCGGLSCICGVCIAPCAADASCNVSGLTTTCQQPSAGAPIWPAGRSWSAVPVRVE